MSDFRNAIEKIGTLLLAWLATLLFIELHAPLPWMLGPLTSIALASMLGLPTRSWDPLRNIGQWIIGIALGLYFTPAVAHLLISAWWVIALSITWSLILGYFFGVWLHFFNAPHMTNFNRATSYFSGPIGGASEMTLLSERENAVTDLVASAHSMRLLIVTLVIPFGIQWANFGQIQITQPVVREISLWGMGVLAHLTAIGIFVMMKLKRANPWFMGAMLVSMIVTMMDVRLTALPSEATNIAQLFIGVSLGVRFNRQFVKSAPRWLFSVAIGTFGMIFLCILFSYVLLEMTHLPFATLILASAPGGITEMAITAKVLQLGAPIVTVFQSSRLVAVLLLSGPLYQWLYVRKTSD